MDWETFLSKYDSFEKQQSEACIRGKMEKEDSYEAKVLLEGAKSFWKDPISFSQGINHFCKKKLFIKAKKKTELPPFHQWIATSESWRNPDSLYQSRLLGPRWNCFAQVGLIYIKVKKSLLINSEILSNKSDAWTVVVYDVNLQGVALFDSIENNTTKEIHLPEGVYIIIHRCYTDDDHLYCPELVIDSSNKIEAKEFLGEKKQYQEYLSSLAENPNPLFYLQQYYIFHWLKTSSVDLEKTRKEYLPIGNPKTEFLYGFLPKKKSLQTIINEESLESFRIYIATFDQMSIPIKWKQITLQEETITSNKDCSYLIRSVPRRGKNSTINIEVMNC